MKVLESIGDEYCMKKYTYIHTLCMYINHETSKFDSSNTKDFHAASVAYSYPVDLRRGGRPLDLVDLSLSSVRQDWDLDGLRHLLNVPNQSLTVISCSDGRGGVVVMGGEVLL